MSKGLRRRHRAAGGSRREFLGEVVLVGDGRQGLPEIAVEYPLCLKRSLPPGAVGSEWREAGRVALEEEAGVEGGLKEEDIEEAALAGFNEQVGGLLTVRFSSTKEAEKMAAEPCVATKPPRLPVPPLPA